LRRAGKGLAPVALRAPYAIPFPLINPVV